MSAAEARFWGLLALVVVGCLLAPATRRLARKYWVPALFLFLAAYPFLPFAHSVRGEQFTIAPLSVTCHAGLRGFARVSRLRGISCVPCGRYIAATCARAHTLQARWRDPSATGLVS